jgi:hypothetical protein
MSKRLAEERQRNIDQMLQQLTSTDPAERREAAYYLGEAAAGEAVDTLIDVYENDEDRSVRKAAAYALGMFKAVERELARGNQQKVVRLLEKVENEGRLGKRANRSGLYTTILLLIVLALILFGLYLYLPDFLETSNFLVTAGLVTPTPDPRAQALPIVRDTLTRTRTDLTTLQSGYQTVQRGGQLDCTVFFNNPSPIPPAAVAGFGSLEGIVNGINGVVVDLISSKGRFDTACSTGANPSGDDVNTALNTITSALNRLAAVEPELASIEAQLLPPTPLPTSPPTTPTEPVVLANPQSHLAALFGLVDNMTGTLGAVSILQQYWTDAQRTGSTDGCRATQPRIPQDYVLPEVDIAASPELAQAVTLINEGLAATRTGWTDFILACNSQQVSLRSNTGLSTARAAFSSFEAARILLVAVQTGG